MSHATLPTESVRPNPWVASATLAQRESVRFLRQRSRLFGALGQPLIFWLLMGEGFSGANLGYADFFPGVLVMILLFTAIFATVSVIEDRREGFLQSVLVAPIPRWSMVLGKVLGGTLLAAAQGVAFLLLGWFSLGLDLGPLQLVGLLLVIAILSFALTSLGLILAWRMDSVQGFHAVMMLGLFPMWLLSGAFFPGSAGKLDWIVAVNPLTYGVAAVRRLVGLAETTPQLAGLTVSVVVTILFAAVAFALACQSAGRRTSGDLR